MPTENKLNGIMEVVQNECIAFRVRLLNRAVTAIYDKALRGSGLTVNQFGMLMLVSRMENATAKKAARFMLMDPSTVSRNLERMRKRGWLRGTPGEDARSMELEITEKGLRALEKAQPAWRKAQVRVREVLGEENAESLKSVVDQMSATGSFQ